MPNQKNLPREKLDNLSNQPGVYLFKDKSGKIIYVGKANVLKNRGAQLFQSSRNLDGKTRLMVNRIADVETILLDNEIEALILEANLIKKHKPGITSIYATTNPIPIFALPTSPFRGFFVTRKLFRMVQNTSALHGRQKFTLYHGHRAQNFPHPLLQTFNYRKSVEEKK